jgi:hypothetical protein
LARFRSPYVTVFFMGSASAEVSEAWTAVEATPRQTVARVARARERTPMLVWAEEVVMFMVISYRV